MVVIAPASTPNASNQPNGNLMALEMNDPIYGKVLMSCSSASPGGRCRSFAGFTPAKRAFGHDNSGMCFRSCK